VVNLFNMKRKCYVSRVKPIATAQVIHAALGALDDEMETSGMAPFATHRRMLSLTEAASELVSASAGDAVPERMGSLARAVAAVRAGELLSARELIRAAIRGL
jgi:hypothetical protein